MSATFTPRRGRRLWHLALLPVYLCPLVLLGTLLNGQSPESALWAGMLTAGMALLPAWLAVWGAHRGSGRILRLALLALVAEILCLGGFLSPGRKADYGVRPLDAAQTRARLEYAGKVALPAVVEYAREIAANGARQTGSAGLARTLEYVKRHLARRGWDKVASGSAEELAAPPPPQTVRVTPFPVLVPEDLGSRLELPDAKRTLAAYALLPNAVQPCATPEEGLRAPLVYLGTGAAADLEGKSVAGKIAVFEFASADRWLWACDQGARGAVFLAGSAFVAETLRQADEKYLALAPLNFPRVYVPESSAVRAAAQRGETAVLHARMSLHNTETPVLEALIPGQSPRELLLMCHADARSIAPALSFGGEESFGLATWLALFDYFSENRPAFSLRFVLNTGHWQSQAAGRAYAYAIKEALGERIALALGIDLNPESGALIATDESANDSALPSRYGWLKKLLFTVDRRQPGWIDQIEALSPRRAVDRGDKLSKYQFFSGRPTTPGSQWVAWLAPANEWPPLSHSASFPAASQMISQVGGASLALQTCNTYRQAHFTCQDTAERWLDKTANLAPQLELSFALIGAIADLEPARFPVFTAFPFRDYGGYNTAEVQVLRWNPRILWYEKRPPAAAQTFALLVPADARFLPGRSNAYWPRVLAPSRFQHRLLQCFQTLYLAQAGPDGRARFENIYSPRPDVSYDALAFTLDSTGRLTHVFDQGMHGDAEFHFLDRRMAAAHMLFQVPVFECGAVVLPSLLETERGNVTRQAENECRVQWRAGGNDQDDGEIPFLPIAAINDVETHTAADSHAWLQYRQIGMAFLKPGQHCEVLAGNLQQQRTLIFNDDPVLRAKTAASAQPPDGEYLGFEVAVGEERHLVNSVGLSFQQLNRITQKRLSAYAELNIKSPQAKLFQTLAGERAQEARAAEKAGHPAAASAAYALALSEQSQAYRYTYRLLVDVVTTTVFYFVLLLPFGYLVERLLFPQPVLWRTCVVVAAVFLLFTALLYTVHPGMHLASNIFVTIVTFGVVILTLPALLITVGRGLTLAVEPAARFKRRHSADTERWGMTAAALSLAVNNMRRRKLRTGLTLATITVLVMALVVLTSTAADTQFFREKQRAATACYHGLQVFNTRDHTHGMSEAAVEILRARHRDKATVVVRRYFNPGYDVSLPCFILPGEQRFAVRGAIALDPLEKNVSGLAQALSAGRFFEPADVHACLLPDGLARRLKLSVGGSLRFLGTELKIVGLLNETAVDAQVVDVSGKPVTPLAFYRPALSAEDPEYLLANETLFVPSALIREETPAPFPAFSVVLVPKAPEPAQIAQRAAQLRQWLEAARKAPHSGVAEQLPRLSRNELNRIESDRLSQLAEDADAAAALETLAAYNLERRALSGMAEEIARDLSSVDVFVTKPAPPWQEGAADQVELVSAEARVSLRSSSFLILPFVVSFLMLLAVMIGNVYERRNEIQIFSSVGLAPRHVAGMFLAEALVYAGIASVLGYFLGIILLDLFRRAGCLPADFNPNYFGKVVIWSAVLATGASVLSVLYPMRIASRMVNPSLERVWRIDSAPSGDDWRIILPFVAGERAELLGILQFAREFLGHHCGERTGAFAVEDDLCLSKRSGQPRLSATIWLSPFERDLTQTIALAPQYDAAKNRYTFELLTHRLSGPDYLWRKANHAFVDALRKQLLIWRSLREDVVAEYVAEGAAALEPGTAAAAGEGGPRA